VGSFSVRKLSSICKYSLNWPFCLFFCSNLKTQKPPNLFALLFEKWAGSVVFELYGRITDPSALNFLPKFPSNSNRIWILLCPVHKRMPKKKLFSYNSNFLRPPLDSQNSRLQTAPNQVHSRLLEPDAVWGDFSFPSSLAQPHALIFQLCCPRVSLHSIRRKWQISNLISRVYHLFFRHWSSKIQIRGHVLSHIRLVLSTGEKLNHHAKSIRARAWRRLDYFFIQILLEASDTAAI
jgi:hypothetical protein